jgi:GDP-D-mannose dehydratase
MQWFQKQLLARMRYNFIVLRLTKKIALAAARVSRGQQKELTVGETNRHLARPIPSLEYVKATCAILRRSQLGDFVIATSHRCS